MRKRGTLLLGGLAIATVLMAGCGESGETIATDGSTSMEKVIGALGEAYMMLNDEIEVTYNPTGSGTGITAVAEGRCDIGLSSRALKESERAAGLIGTPLAYDGIAVIVHLENPVGDLTTEEIARIYTGEVTNWSELGGEDLEIVRIGREAASGTRDGFETATGTEGLCEYRQELTSTGDVITTVAQNPNAIGYASIASIKDNVKMVKVNGVEPSEETIRDGSYVIQRPFLLVTKQEVVQSETVQGFYDWILSEEANAIIIAAGAVPAN